MALDHDARKGRRYIQRVSQAEAVCKADFRRLPLLLVQVKYSDAACLRRGHGDNPARDHDAGKQRRYIYQKVR